MIPRRHLGRRGDESHTRDPLRTYPMWCPATSYASCRSEVGIYGGAVARG